MINILTFKKCFLCPTKPKARIILANCLIITLTTNFKKQLESFQRLHVELTIQQASLSGSCFDLWWCLRPLKNIETSLCMHILASKWCLMVYHYEMQINWKKNKHTKFISKHYLFRYYFQMTNILGSSIYFKPHTFSKIVLESTRQVTQMEHMTNSCYLPPNGLHISIVCPKAKKKT